MIWRKKRRSSKNNKESTRFDLSLLLSSSLYYWGRACKRLALTNIKLRAKSMRTQLKRNNSVIWLSFLCSHTPYWYSKRLRERPYKQAWASPWARAPFPISVHFVFFALLSPISIIFLAPRNYECTLFRIRLTMPSVYLSHFLCFNRSHITFRVLVLILVWRHCET